MSVVESGSREGMSGTRFPEQESLKAAHQALRDLTIVMEDLGQVPTGATYAHAINLAAHVTSSLTAGDHHRRFAEAEGIRRGPVKGDGC